MIPNFYDDISISEFGDTQHKSKEQLCQDEIYQMVNNYIYKLFDNSTLDIIEHQLRYILQKYQITFTNTIINRYNNEISIYNQQERIVHLQLNPSKET